MGTLLNWNIALQRAGGEFRIFGVPPLVKKGMGDEIPFYETQAEALKDIE